MERTKRPQIPSFGDWNYYNELPITQYFESAMQAGLVRSSHCSEEEVGEREGRGAFYLASPVKPTHRQSRPKERRSGAVKQRKKVTIKPVDEDLYKIPPELIQKPRRILAEEEEAVSLLMSLATMEEEGLDVAVAAHELAGEMALQVQCLEGLRAVKKMWIGAI